MKFKIYLISGIAVALLSFNFYCIAHGGEREPCQILPEELLELARKKGLDQVFDFYKNKPGMLNPPYVYGYLPGPEENSAVFWCQRGQKGKRPYFLVFMFKDKSHKLCECPDVIEWHNYPKGLSIYKDRNTTLEHFIYIKDPKRKVPKTLKLSHNAILSEYDGVSAIFYCHGGEWLVWMRD